MKSLFEKEALQEIHDRLDQLTPGSERQWGQMDVAQMLKHVHTTMKIATGEVSIHTPPWHKRMVFRLYRSLLYNDRPWKQNLPTARELRVVNPEDFHKEKSELLTSMQNFLNLPFESGSMKHPVFGTFTKEQWGKMQYKHLDHHLRQFGV